MVSYTTEVSVSSSGSRRSEPTSPSPARSGMPFQYPQADRDGRNDTDGRTYWRECWFQYPQADRDGRNARDAGATGCEVCVSVSSSGSRRSELGWKTSIAVNPLTFQYPQADRDGRNYTHQVVLLRIQCQFQYPQADRDGRNRRQDGFSDGRRGVSVSSSGSRRSELTPRDVCAVRCGVSVSSSGSRRSELRRHVRQRRCECGFSILKRIETVGTRQLIRGGQVVLGFSILKRIETVGTTPAPAAPRRPPQFQYPQADRDGRNGGRRSPAWYGNRFQYPQADRDGRNWVAGLKDLHAVVFQYPQADRDGRNTSRSCRSFPAPRVSVSSSGSRRSELSRRVHLGAERQFQYPQADRDGRNRSTGSCSQAFGRVSVSSSGSRRSEQGQCVHQLSKLRVSVSSSGSRRSERPRTTSGNGTSAFQYPQADRDGRNRVY